MILMSTIRDPVSSSQSADRRRWAIHPISAATWRCGVPDVVASTTLTYPRAVSPCSRLILFQSFRKAELRSSSCSSGVFDGSGRTVRVIKRRAVVADIRLARCLAFFGRQVSHFQRRQRACTRRNPASLPATSVPVGHMVGLGDGSGSVTLLLRAAGGVSRTLSGSIITRATGCGKLRAYISSEVRARDRPP